MSTHPVQLYLFPELEPVIPSGKKKRNRSTEKDAISAPLTVQDFLGTLAGGFMCHHDLLTLEPSCPLQFLRPYLVRMCPVHNKAIAEWRKRFSDLQRLIADLYVDLHAQAEKDHPEWFKNAEKIDPEVTRIMPFLYKGLLPAEPLRGQGRIELEDQVCDNRSMAGLASIPLSVVADKVREKDLHLPTFLKNVFANGKWNRETTPVFDPFKNVEVACITPNPGRTASPDDPIVLKFVVGHTNDNRRPNNLNYGVNSWGYEVIPNPFTKLPIGQLMIIHSNALHANPDSLPDQERSTDYGVTETVFRFPLFSTTDEERDREAEEMKAAAAAAGREWKTFFDSTLKRLHDTALNDIRAEESRLMARIEAVRAKESQNTTPLHVKGVEDDTQ